MKKTVVIVEKNGDLKEVSTNINDLNIDKITKLCGFRKSDGFEEAIWEVEHEECIYDIHLFGKTEGRANSENKYDFPPPVDETLFFGNCALIACKNNTEEIIDLTIEIWNEIYELLFGGFEDLGSDDSSEEDELDNIPAEMKTEEGYLKDGFIVDDGEELIMDDVNSDDDDDDEYEDNDEELEEEMYIYSDED